MSFTHIDALVAEAGHSSNKSGFHLYQRVRAQALGETFSVGGRDQDYLASPAGPRCPRGLK